VPSFNLGAKPCRATSGSAPSWRDLALQNSFPAAWAASVRTERTASQRCSGGHSVSRRRSRFATWVSDACPHAARPVALDHLLTRSGACSCGFPGATIPPIASRAHPPSSNQARLSDRVGAHLLEFCRDLAGSCGRPLRCRQDHLTVTAKPSSPSGPSNPWCPGSGMFEDSGTPPALPNRVASGS